MPASAFRTLLGVVAFLFPIAVVFENKLTPIFLAGILAGTVLLARPLQLRLRTPLVAGFGLLLAWALLSALWSIDSMHSLARFARLLLTVGGGVLLCGIAAARPVDGRQQVGLSFALGFAVAGAIVVYAWSGAPFAPAGAIADYVARMPFLAFGAIAVPCIFTLIAMLEERPIAPLIPMAIAAGVAGIVLRGNSASSIALVAGAIAAGAVFWLGRKAVLALAVALPVLFLGSTLLLQAVDIPARAKDMGWTLGASSGHRLIIWRYVSKGIMERPGLGWGLHTSRILPGREKSVADDPEYADILEVTRFGPNTRIELIPMHPHNATLQTWLELGVVGAILYSALYALCLWAMSRVVLSRTARAAGAGAVVAIFMIGQLSFSVWQSWWLCTQFLAAAFFLFVVRKTAPPVRPDRNLPSG